MSIHVDHPYEDVMDGVLGGMWLRGNLHLHPRPKDRPDDVAQWYAAAGYGFLGLTEHDKFYSLEDIAEWNHCGMVLIPGNEVTKNGPHILHLDADRQVEPDPDRQKVIDQINGSSGFAIVNHPNLGSDFDGCPLATLQQLTGYVGIEIFNASGFGGMGSAYATDKWDMLLSQGRRLWGFASDDYHHRTDAQRGWIMAFVKQRTREAVLDALRQGRFYASTGVTIDRIAVDGRHIRVEASDADRIVAISDYGRRVATSNSHALEVYAGADRTYVRFECWGGGERQAWTQPFWMVKSG